MECCVGVPTETVLQVIKFYTVVKKNFKNIVFLYMTKSHQFVSFNAVPNAIKAHTFP